MPWKSHENPMKIQVFRGFSMGFPWLFHGFSMGCPWVVHGLSIAFPMKIMPTLTPNQPTGAQRSPVAKRLRFRQLRLAGPGWRSVPFWEMFVAYVKTYTKNKVYTGCAKLLTYHDHDSSEYYIVTIIWLVGQGHPSEKYELVLGW